MPAIKPLRCLAFALLALLVLAPAAFAQAAGAEKDVADARAIIQRATAAAQAGDLAAAKQEYDRYENTWFDIEDGVRARSRDSYRAIEKEMSNVSNAFDAKDQAKIVAALGALDREQQAFVSGQPPVAGSAPASSPAGAKPTMDIVLTELHDAQTALAANDYATASARLNSFEADWLEVE